MSDVTYRSDVTVELIDSMASDQAVVRSARVSTIGEASRIAWGGSKDVGLIEFLMTNRHGSPFEHAVFTLYIEAPIFVFRELMRHRIASYNEESARYTKLKPVFYVPAENRKLVQVGKAGAYEFEAGTPEQHEIVRQALVRENHYGFGTYEWMLDNGIAREVARMVLPVNIYSSAYMTINSRSLMNLLSLRVRNDDAAYPSFPQREIEMVAEKAEGFFARQMPVTHEAFLKNGRVAP